MKKITLIIISFLITAVAFSQSYSASFTYSHIQGMDYEFTLSVSTDTINIPEAHIIKVGSDKDTLYLDSKQIINDIAIVKYKSNYTFISSNYYTVVANVGAREPSIGNIPNSVNTNLVITAELTISNSVNNTTIVDTTFMTVNAYCGINNNIDFSLTDLDGDSLVYKLIPCRSSANQFVNGYTFPGESNNFLLDAVTGNLSWDHPMEGKYSILLSLEEYKNTVLISRTEHERQIVVIDNTSINSTTVEKLRVKTYPNPCSNYISIKTDLKLKNVEYKIYDITSKVVKEGRLRKSNSRIKVKGLNPGTYIISIKTEDKILEGKFIKN